MPVNGVRVLPDIPKNMPNMEILKREFETGSMSVSQDIVSKSSTLNDGNFVKKIVEVYESSIKASNENNQWKRAKERSGFFNTLDVVQNQKNVEQNGSSPAIYDVPSSQCRNNFNKKSKISFTLFEASEAEDDFMILNRYRSKSNRKIISETWPEPSPKINMYCSMDDLLMNAQSSLPKRNETCSLKKRDKKLKSKSMKDKLVTCSSPVGHAEDKHLDREELLDDILTSSCDSSSNNSYKNLKTDLYDFDQWKLEFSSISSSLSSLQSSLGSSQNNMLNVNKDDNSMLLDSSFQDVVITSSKDIPNRENLQDSKPVSSLSNFDRKPPSAIGVSLNENQPTTIKTNNDTCITWISTLSERLSRKKSLKNLLKSTFNVKLLNYKEVWKKLTEKQPSERTSDSGLIERFLSPSSSISQKFWRYNLDEKPSPTFETFGHTTNVCVNKTWPKNSRMILTELPREEFTSNSKSSNSTARVSLHRTNSCKENHWNVESSLKSTMLANASKLRASCGYPPLSKHPYLTRNGIPKHPFIAKTKLDQTMAKESVEEEEEEAEEMRCDAKEREFDTCELEPSGMSSVSKLNIPCSRMSEWLASFPNNNCDLSRSRSYKSTSALDGLVPEQIPVHNVPMLRNFSTDFLSTIRNNVHREPCTHRYATVNPKNLRFSMSREKLRAIERNFDV